MVIWNILQPLGIVYDISNFWYFSPLWYIVPKQSGNPVRKEKKHEIYRKNEVLVLWPRKKYGAENQVISR
jgi:hypothetical protein